MKISNIAIAFILIAMIFLLIFPLPTFMMDFLLVISISLSLIVLLFALYIKNPLEFSIFPTLLLFLTLFRMSLALSSMRLILGNGGNAGHVIQAFGSVVIAGNLVIGLITFFIIMVIQFMVITKGAERVAEVTARFTLDAMPGKQMAIDADLNSGLIDEIQARERREVIQAEADFNGSMDGASKFIKGEAIAGILITFINIIGGFVIGMMTMNLPIGEVFGIFTLSTIGDGLVSQIPAMLTSFAAGIIVTRSSTGETFGDDVSRQVLSQPFVIIMAGVLMMIIGVVPGLPHMMIWIIAAGLIAIGYTMHSRAEKRVLVEQEDEAEKAAADKRKPEYSTQKLQVDPLEVFLGYGLIAMADPTQGGDLIERVANIRNEMAYELGILVPIIRMRDNLKLGANKYSIHLKGIEIAHGEVMADYLLALPVGEVEEEIAGIPTVDPTFGAPALWIPKSERENAELLGYSMYDPPTVITTHIHEIIRRHAYELLSRQTVQSLLDNLRRTQPALVDECVPKMFSLGEIQKILAALLQEDVPVRDMATILETIADNGNITRDTETLTEFVRVALKRTLSNRFIASKPVHFITLDASLEQAIADTTKQTERGSYLTMDTDTLNRIFKNLQTVVESVTVRGQKPVILTSALVRRQFRKIAEQLSPELVVMSHNEVVDIDDAEVYSEGVVTL